MNAEDYKNQLIALLPRGELWESLSTDPTFLALLDAEAQEFGRIDARISNLLDEANPAKTLELLEEWEAFASLPDPCLGEALTIQDRQNALVSRLTSMGGQSRQYFIDIAAAIGFTITITEFPVFKSNRSRTGMQIRNEHAKFTWQVNGALQISQLFKTNNNQTGDKLGSVKGNAALECLIALYKPAHTVVLFSYT